MFPSLLLVAVAVLAQHDTARPHQQLTFIVQPHHAHLTGNWIEQRELTEFLVECSPLMCFTCKCEGALRLYYELELRSCSKPCHLNGPFEWVW